MQLRALVTVVLFASGAIAQTGVVKSNGLPIPGATVTATQGGRKIVTTTDESGRYSFEGLTPGPCVFDVQMFGFRTEHREAQVPGELDWTLQIPQRPDPAAFRARANQANQTETELNNEIAAAAAPPPPGASSDSANESFLVQGSLSQGLQNGREDAVLPQRPFGQFGGGPPGTDGFQAGAPGQPGLVQTPGGPAPAGGPGQGAGGPGG